MNNIQLNPAFIPFSSFLKRLPTYGEAHNLLNSNEGHFFMEERGLALRIDYFGPSHNQLSSNAPISTGASRCWKHAHQLKNLNIQCPTPLGYIETQHEKGLISFYISHHEPAKFNLRDILLSEHEDRELIIENYLFFLENSLQKNEVIHQHFDGTETHIHYRNGAYEFSLNKMVDLNFGQKFRLKEAIACLPPIDRPVEKMN
ncbi:hypothetical protein [Persicobacter psychrovividus]|uniref:Uncharacterized protein n=1 Tax=Persicobacter psychrovividus TaxID=387638 RepID=A0ABM7VJA7_9BACT|nr:hypothetical protein PEPS_33640 [Persicobacter psychrovividus]